MAMAPRLQELLGKAGVRYQLVPHPRSRTSIETADYADIPGDRLVKAVVLEDEQGKLLAVLPSTRSVHLGHLTTQLDRRVRLADEDEIPELFPDCKPGAIPPVGAAYGLRMVVDSALAGDGDVYFEAGDHENLVRVQAARFAQLLGGATRVDFAARERHATRHPQERGSGSP